ncbi:MAG: threonine--tRNA ligase, partial [Verrucomicrobia bacterium]
TGNIGAFKLTTVASAYYKGDEKNPQLQRVYGTAFKTKKELDDYFGMLEEAKKRDHRKLGKELEIFVLDDDVGPGLPMWLPRGAAIIEELEKLAKETEFAAGYVRVRTPHIARESLYKKSGHLPYYADSMFPPMELKYDPAEEHQAAGLEATIGKKMEQIKAFENIFTGLGMEEAAKDHRESLQRLEENKRELATLNSKRNEILSRSRYYLKAMNCPHHHKLFAAVPRSYRDLPLRFAEYGTCYRYEQSGELFGLMRVRSMQMNDAHLYMTPEQFETEFNAVNEMYLKYFKLFGIGKYLMRFSTHDPTKLGQKFVDESELWKQTEEMTRNVLKSSGINYVEVPNEAAFYGPKIDVQAWSVIGREFSIATNQVDFAQPRRFDLRYKDRDNVDKIPLCIHRAPLGTHERFIGFLIEHYAGNFPLWLSPEQVRILTIGDEPQLLDYSRAILDELRSHQVRAEIDASTDKINGKIQRAEQMKVHTMFVIGKRDMEANAVSVRVHGKGNLGAKSSDEVIVDILSSIKERRA